MVKTCFETSRGFPSPLGTSKHVRGINFALFSKHATAVSLSLFSETKKRPIAEISLDPNKNRTGDVWHIFVYDLPDNILYGYRVDGPFNPQQGFFYDNRNVLLDPYCKLVDSPHEWENGPYRKPTIHTGYAHPLTPFDWGDDEHPRIPFNDLIIYEMHVRGYTQDPSSQATHRGTFLAIIEKIPHLKKMGVNAIELMPVFEFNERESLFNHPNTRVPLGNFWGYSTVSFFAPMNRYATHTRRSIVEFKTLVKELHRAGIEIILDVVYNHTSEGNQAGPTISFRGLENNIYYMMTPNHDFYNFTGCGNTMNCNHPIVRDFIRDSLRYWVKEMHVDGFRFDLASILVRGENGVPLENPPLIETLSEDPVLANTKLIAEAWDAGGLYQVGSFPGRTRWAEWNGQYRDCIRCFIKGTDGYVGTFATRLSGSEDLYGNGRQPSNSINFITAHDGFTLADLVSYNEKHNELNGEENRDGDNHNESWNCGHEGSTNDKDVVALRSRQMRNFHVALMVSQGVPMLLMGDEYGHTKLGNNNTWGHDSCLNWFQWDKLKENSAFFRFYTMMIALRKNHPVLTRSRFLQGNDVVWHGEEPKKPDWSPESRLLAFSLPDMLNHYTLYIAFNASHEEKCFHLPRKKRTTPYKRLVDTSLPSPDDIVDEVKAPTLDKDHYTLLPHSSLILKI